MNKKKVDCLNVSSKCLKKVFDQYMPNSTTQIEEGECYGKMNGAKFFLQIKKHPRSIKTLFDECLCGEVHQDGSIKYSFRRTAEALLVTVFTPLLMLIAALVLGIGMEMEEAFLFTIPAVGLASCYFIRPKSLRRDLLDKLMQLVELGNNTRISDL